MVKDFCRKQERRTQCEPVIEEGTGKQVCAPFEVCLPFGRSLSYDGYCMRVTGVPTIPDGEYGIIVVENGCIVGARPNPVFEYTPDPCTPATGPCNDTDGGGVVLQPGICNLLTQDGSGRLGAFLSIEAGEGVDVTGCGSVGDPLVITAKPGEAARTYIQSVDAQAITITGSGLVNDPYMVTLTEVMTPGTYGSFTVDEYGRITRYEATEGGTITSIIAGPGIVVSSSDGVATVSLKESRVQAGDYLVGGFTMGVDMSGIITNMQQAIGIEAGQYDPYNNYLTLNELGSVTEVTPIFRSAANFSVTHGDGGTEVVGSIDIDRQGRLYVCWRGHEPLPTGASIPATQVGVYTSRVSGLMTGTINGQTGFRAIVGLVGSYTSTGSGSSTTAYRLYEWRGESSRVYNPGTYEVTLTLTGDSTAFQNASVLEIYLV